RFDRVDVKVGSTGMPLLLGVIGSLECRVTEVFDAGDQTIFLGEVLEITLDEGRPLIYFQGEYHRLEGGGRR
ncbi:MAG: flavin reductase family protein, partial [Actinomycetota bacterium]